MVNRPAVALGRARAAGRGKTAFIAALGLSVLMTVAACGSGGSTSSGTDTSNSAPSGSDSASADDTSSGSAVSASGSGEVTTVKILAFKPPSLGAFLPAIIDDQDLDAAHGLDMQFTYATPDNYNAEFSAGHFPLGASAALLSEALRTERGADVTYLFNLFDYFGAVVTSNPDIKTLPDLEGGTLAAATGTTNYAMFEWFAQKAGLDVSTVETQNQTPAGLSTMALTGRTDAVELWEPAYSTLLAKKPDIRTLDMNIGAWKTEFGTDVIPYLGVAAQSAWAKDNPDLVQALYDTYKDAADWTQANAEQAATIIAKTIPSGDAAVVQKLIERNELLRMAVAPASEVADGIKGVFEAGQQTGYLTKEPPESVIYSGLK